MPKISQLPELASVTSDDLFVVINDPAGTPATRKVTAQNLLQFVESGLGVIDVADGGTGATSLTGYVKGNGTSPFTTTATIPGDDVSGNISGNAANVTGVVAVANGGTGATNAATARTNLQVPYTFGTGGTSVVAWQAGSNVASGNYCVVGGGQSNTSSGSYSFVGGGYKNTSAVGSVSAGLNNTASGGASVVAGGGIAGKFTVTIGSPGVFAMFRHGLVAGDAIVLETTGALPSGLASNTTYYVINAGLGPNLFSVSETPGGAANNTSGSQSGTHTLRSLTARNVASGNGSVVGGGVKNAAGGPQAAVGGGRSNTASGYVSTVGGGRSNTASGYVSTVGGGRDNTASGYASVVAGGGWYNSNAYQFESNTAGGDISAVGGGALNFASALASTVGGGQSNTASGNYSAVGGGSFNTSSAMASAVGGGNGNTANNYASAVGGGLNNRSAAICSVVSGGYNNTASGGASAVGGGRENTSSGLYATIPGGKSNTATHSNVFLLGSNLVSGANDTTYVENLNVKNNLTLSSPLSVANGGTGATSATALASSLGFGTLATQNQNNVTITGGNVSLDGLFNVGLLLSSDAFSTAKMTARSPVTDLCGVDEVNIFTVPTGYMFLVDTMEIVTTSISGAGTPPKVRFGTVASPDLFHASSRTTSNAFGERHIVETPQNGVDAGSVVSFGVTEASTASSHLGVAVVTGYLLKKS